VRVGSQFFGSHSNTHYFPSYRITITYNANLRCHIVWVGNVIFSDNYIPRVFFSVGTHTIYGAFTIKILLSYKQHYTKYHTRNHMEFYVGVTILVNKFTSIVILVSSSTFTLVNSSFVKYVCHRGLRFGWKSNPLCNILIQLTTTLWIYNTHIFVTEWRIILGSQIVVVTPNMQLTISNEQVK
jgi:hypothetical protein